MSKITEAILFQNQSNDLYLSIYNPRNDQFSKGNFKLIFRRQQGINDCNFFLWKTRREDEKLL